MDKQIPIYFDSVVISSPLEAISDTNPNISRLKVRVFTKYGNRNGSYITDEVADQLIKSATTGNTPVIGFFDPETKTWASHSGPTLANGYGYVEDFLGWEPFTDTDGTTREYAVFSVILFTNYYEEARTIIGQNQSMELDPNSITGDWVTINDTEYYVYSTAKMLGFCVIGSHEPCFSVSSFFAKNDNEYKTQYDKFSSLLADLKLLVEEAKSNTKGGEQPMNDLENQEVVEESPAEASEIIEDNTNFEAAKDQEEVVETPVESEEVPEESETPAEETNEGPTEYDLLLQQYNELQNSLEQVQQELDTAKSRISEFEQSQATLTEENNQLRTTNEELQASLQNYEAQALAAEEEKKNELVNKYEKIINNAEEIEVIRKSIKDFSYDELEGKLAIMFANQQMAGSDINEKVPLPEPPESQFALLMKKYRKN